MEGGGDDDESGAHRHRSPSVANAIGKRIVNDFQILIESFQF